MTTQTSSTVGPPDFASAKNRRQKHRAAGLHPDYWYPAEWDAALKVGEVKEVVFWKKSIALYRGADGVVRALENRCAHRQLKLTRGVVTDCSLTCSYHGWTYDQTGKCTSMAHSLFGHAMPSVSVQSYAVQVKHGIIWICPGDATKVMRGIPEVAEWSEASGWGRISIDFTWNAHHSMIIDNTCDFTHAYLHRVRKPFTHAELKGLRSEGDEVELEYATQVGQGRIQRLLVNRKTTNVNAMTLGYSYPYQWSNTDDKIKHWCFVLPIDERTTRAFFLFYFSPAMVKIPLLPLHMPRRMVSAIMPLAKRFMVRPLLDEDGVAVQAEQEGYDAHFEQPITDLNPVSREFQKLTIRKWEEHLAAQPKPRARPADARSEAD